MAKSRKPSTLERMFLTLWENETDGDPALAPEREYEFSAARGWRLDFAWPSIKLAVEIHGGQWTRGRHQRGKGFAADLEKMNAAQLAGWTVLQFTTDHMTKMPVQVVEKVARLVRELRP